MSLAVRRSVIPPQPEAQFQTSVVNLARIFHWRAYHTRDSRGSAAGFPDLVLVRRPRVIFAELKSAKGTLTIDQVAWLDDLERCSGVETYVWRPGGMQQIAEVLR